MSVDKKWPIVTTLAKILLAYLANNNEIIVQTILLMKGQPIS